MNGEAEIVPVVFGLFFYGMILLVGLGFQLLICFLLYKNASAIPNQFRLAQPGQAFLLLIPLFNLVWIFIYTSNLSQSFQNLFRQHHQLADDCGKQTGMWWGITLICSIIPCLGIISSIAALILMILYLVKTNECKNKALALSTPFKTPPMPAKDFGQGNPFR